LTDLRVVDFLNSTPFASIRQIATATKIPQSIAFDHLKGWISIMRHLKWVRHHLTTVMTEQRVELSRELLVTLKSAKHHGWTRFLAGDEL
jgi:hypothetical protein